MVPIRNNHAYVLHVPIAHHVIEDLIRRSRELGSHATAKSHGRVTLLKTCQSWPCEVTTFVAAGDRVNLLWFQGEVDGTDYVAGWYDLPTRWEEMTDFLTQLAEKKGRGPIAHYVHEPWDYRNLVELIETIRWGLEVHRCDKCGFELRGWHPDWLIYRRNGQEVTRCPIHIDAALMKSLGGTVVRRKFTDFSDNTTRRRYLGFLDDECYVLDR